MDDAQQLLTADDVAALIQRSVGQVLRLWRQGELGGYQLGHRGVRFTQADIATYLEAHRRDAR